MRDDAVHIGIARIPHTLIVGRMPPPPPAVQQHTALAQEITITVLTSQGDCLALRGLSPLLECDIMGHVVWL